MHNAQLLSAIVHIKILTYAVSQHYTRFAEKNIAAGDTFIVNCELCIE